MMDYIFRRLALDHLPFEQRAELGILSAAERAAQAAGQDPAEVDPIELAQSFGGEIDYPERTKPSPQPPAPAQSSPAPPATPTEQRTAAPHSTAELVETQQGRTADAPLCLTCGTKMRPAGSCYVCEGCGSTSGCSLWTAFSATLDGGRPRLKLGPLAIAMLVSAFHLCDYRNMDEDEEWRAIGERLRRTRLITGISQAELGQRIGLDRTMVAKIEAGTRRIGALELTQISRVLDIPIGYLLEPVPPVMSRRSGVALEDFDSEVARHTGRMEIALAAWLRDIRQLIEFGTLSPPSLLVSDRPADSEGAAREIAIWVRGVLGYGFEPVVSLAELCERAGQFVLVTEVPGDGASVIDGEVAAAVVSRSGDPGRRRATAAHELGHLVLGDEYSNDLGVHVSRAEREEVIDAFAAELLLPGRVFTDIAAGSSGISRSELVELAARFRVSWTLALRQASRAGVLDSDARRAMAGNRPTRSEFMDAVGWVPQPDLESVRVPPGFAHAVLQAVRQFLITPQRAVELMRGQVSLADLPVDDEADIEP
jgi:transcriptional regulator with XRE-family HTH domain/Zn-dependent peptidase ImmA (M78 family)